jgi:hypothetical protein
MKFPLQSSKRNDFDSWYEIQMLQMSSKSTVIYLDKAIEARKNFNKTRSIFSFNHLQKKLPYKKW